AKAGPCSADGLLEQRHELHRPLGARGEAYHPCPARPIRLPSAIAAKRPRSAARRRRVRASASVRPGALCVRSRPPHASPRLPRAYLNHIGQVLYRERRLFGGISWFSHHLFRGTKLVFHLLAVVNLSDPLEDDPVAHTDSLPDDEDVVVRLVLDDD